MAKSKSPYPLPPAAANSGIPLPLERFFHWEHYNPDGAFIIDYDSQGVQHVLSWREAARQVRALAYHLRSLGVEKGDPVGLWLSSGSKWILADLAIWLAGAVSVILNPD